jgi:hypothetical protein
MATLDVLTFEEAADALNLSGTAIHDKDLPEWITAVSLFMDRLIGPVVTRVVTAEQHDGGRHCIYLRQYPNTAITTVTEYSGTTATVLAPETNTTKPANAYMVDPYEPDTALLTGIVRRRVSGGDALFAQGRRNVEVTYSAGRFASTTTVDQRAKKAASLILSNAWRSQQDSTGGVGEFDVPQVMFPRKAIPAVVRELYFREIQDRDPILI